MKRRRIKRKRFKWIIGVISLIVVFVLSFIVFESNFSNNELDNEEFIVVNPVIEKVYINYLDNGGEFELPINGSSGYASEPLTIYSQPKTSSDIIYRVNPGFGFTILSEQGDWWQISFENELGWVLHDDCFINLPDLIPSIIYDISNSYSSKLKSSYVDIPNVTNLSHYDAQEYSKRFNKDMFIVPVLYKMASKLFQTQQLALNEGNTLIVYDAFRPLEVQKRIVDNLRQLSMDNSEVLEGLTSYPWNIGWFISTGVSNHQKGLAVDMSLGKVVNTEIRTTGDYEYKVVTEYSEYEMPTEIHELSVDSVAFKMPVDSKSTTAWLESELSDHMNEYSIKLQKYATESGLIPIASEWWHFNDLSIVWNGSKGNYYIEHIYSGLPKIQK